MKRISLRISLAIFIFICNLSAYSSNRIYIEDLTVAAMNKPQNIILPINIESTIDITSFQCDLFLPQGVSLSSNVSISENISNSHVIRCQAKEGYTRIICYSSKNEIIQRRSGEIVKLNIEITGGLNVGDYTISLKNIYISDASKPAVGYDVQDQESFLHVEQRTLVTSVSLSAPSAIEVGGSAVIQATVLPENAYNRELLWSSSNENVATINEKGIITGVSEGSVTITAMAKDGTETYGTIQITISDYIYFVDPNVEAVCLQYWDKNKDGLLSRSEAKAVTTLNGYFKKTTAIKLSIQSFDELEYFTGLKTLSNYEFDGCENLQSIRFPISITSIGNSAFYGCKKLQTLIIPEAVSTIGDYAFSGCIGLQSIRVAEGNVKYDSRNDCNALIIKESNTLILGCRNTIIPNSVISIGRFAFRDCGDLTSISIPNSVTTIDEYAFQNCSHLETLYIPSSVNNIASNAFQGCSESLKSIIVEEGNLRYDSRDNSNALVETSSNSLILGCQNTTIPNTISIIGSYAFSGCKDLESIEIPLSVTTICAQAFSDSGIRNLTLPSSLTSLANATFFACTQLKSIVIPSGISTIGVNTFSGCTSLETIVLGDHVTTINDNAFNGCVNIKRINIPASVSTISTKAFTGAILEEVIIDNQSLVENNYTSSGNFLSKVFGTNVYKYCIGESVTKIGDYAFKMSSTTDTELSSVEIPNTVLSIGKYAFSGCAKIENITIPNSVTSINEYAFYNCKGLKNINFGNGLSSVNNYTFKNCSSLETVRVVKPFTIALSVFDGLTLANMTLYVPYGELTTYKKYNIWNKFGTIIAGDEELDYGTFENSGQWSYDKINKVLTIGGNANVYNNSPWNYYTSEIEKIIIEDDVESIGSICQGWQNLKHIVLSHNLTSIDDYAFNGCAKLTDVEMPGSIKTIGNNAFYGCSSLTNIRIPDNVESIGSYSFLDCSSLQELHVGEKVKTIGEFAFAGCTKLSNVTFSGNKISCLETAVFQLCSSLKEIELPSSIKTISSQAFNKCALEMISIPESVNSIDYLAFANCSSLNDIYCYAIAIPSLNANAFDDFETPTLHVPENLISQYKFDSNWGKFKNIVVIKPEATNIDILDNVIYMDSVVISAGGSIDVTIKMKNEGAASAYQFDLILPTGIEIAKNTKEKLLVSLSDRHDGHTLSSSLISDNTYRFAVLSFSSDEITGNNGDILTITLKASDEIEGNEYFSFIENAAYSTPAGQSIDLPQVSSVLLVKDYTLGDVNKDGKIDIADAVGIVNYILGKPSALFEINAADVNKDKKIDIADAVAVVNIILNK